MPYLRDFWGIGIVGSIGQTSNANSGSIMAEGDIDNLTMEHYLSLTRGNEAPGVAWERYNDLLYKCPTHEINSHQKVNIFYNGLGTMNFQLLDSQGPIPSMTPAQALTAIQTMVDHSQKWHDGSSSRNIGSSSNSEGITAIVRAHLDKECPLNEEVKSVEEVKYSEFGRHPPFSGTRIAMAMISFGTVGTAKDPRSRSFDDYKWVFDLEIDQLADEYELWIRKKGHMLDDIWEYCEKVQGDNTYRWHDHGLEEDERQEIGVDIQEYDPPKVQGDHSTALS
ncbi:hypothetical protein Tco_0775369 [Tanacetum coccineum]